MNPICSKLNWKYQKHEYLIDYFILRNVPGFVLNADPGPLEGEIPVFTFHRAFPESFEEQCLYLAENGYRTICSDRFLSILKSKGSRIKNTVMLTFDDGLKHVWTVAYPLLKKYGLSAVCFLNPGCMATEDLPARPTLEEYWKGRASLEEILAMERGSGALANWKEVKIMHESGVVDFQSHTMYHSLVFTSHKIFDFIHPAYNTHYYGNTHVPIYQKDGKDVVSRPPIFGMPIYHSKPRMTAASRYFDDEDIRNRCIETVENGKGADFFKDKDWRRVLRKVVDDSRKKGKTNERYETPDERDHAIFDDLMTSRKVIEERLPGKKVTHLCYPWFEGANFAVSVSKRAGFEANYFGRIYGKPTNRPGDDPFRVVRLDPICIRRLPGAGRHTLGNVARKLFNQWWKKNRT